jgi:hypothetical protein
MHAISVGASATPARGVPPELVLLAENTTDTHTNAAEQDNLYDTDAYTTYPAEIVFTRASDPFNPKHVERVVEAITIGPDLTETQRQEVRDLVAEYADELAKSSWLPARCMLRKYHPRKCSVRRYSSDHYQGHRQNICTNK